MSHRPLCVAHAWRLLLLPILQRRTPALFRWRALFERRCGFRGIRYLSDEERSKIADAIGEFTYQAGEYIIRQVRPPV